LPVLETDLLKLRMVLKNLVHNAIKFTTAGWVKVSVSLQGAGIQFEIADSGPGIPPAQLSRVFDAFHQADEGREQVGVGLGLYIVKRLLERLGGRISVTSEIGQGTTFRVWLPISPPHRDDLIADSATAPAEAMKRIDVASAPAPATLRSSEGS